MNRRNFLSLAIGGVALATARRAFPFRVYSFPHPKITLYPIIETHMPLPERVTVDQNYIFWNKDGVYCIDSIGTHVLGLTKVSVAEAKRIFPGPFHWQGANRNIRTGVLADDGSVADATIDSWS